MPNVPEGFRPTKYPNEWVLERPECVVVVRGFGPAYARCWKGGGGAPLDLHRPTLGDAFEAGLAFANDLSGASLALTGNSP
jgi:hypothetical protein